MGSLPDYHHDSILAILFIRNSWTRFSSILGLFFLYPFFIIIQFPLISILIRNWKTSHSISKTIFTLLGHNFNNSPKYIKEFKLLSNNEKKYQLFILEETIELKNKLHSQRTFSNSVKLSKYKKMIFFFKNFRNCISSSFIENFLSIFSINFYWN